MQNLKTGGRTEYDQYIVRLPVFVRHLNIKIIGNEAVFFYDFKQQHALYGGLSCAVVGLINGQRNTEEICHLLSPQYNAVQVKAVIIKLAQLGLIFSNEHQLPKNMVAFWNNMGASPLYAENALKNHIIYIHYISKKHKKSAQFLTSRLKSIGVNITNNHLNANLAIILADNYLQPDLCAFAQTCYSQQCDFIFAGLDASHNIFGPVFQHNHPDFCFFCLLSRLQSNYQIHNFVAHCPGSKPTFIGQNFQPIHNEILLNNLLLAIANYIVKGNDSLVNNNMLLFDTTNPNGLLNPVIKRPQCHFCGDPHILHDKPFMLEKTPNKYFTGGGMRNETPTETFAKYARHINPWTGVVKHVTKMHHTNDNNGWFYHYNAGQNMANNHSELYLLQTSFRVTSSGKGRSDDEARCSALMESLERASAVYTDKPPTISAQLSQLPGRAINPNDMYLFSEHQYAMAEHINALKSLNYFVHPKYNDEQLEWSQIYSLTHQEMVYIPTSLLYFSYHRPPKHGYCGFAESNGLAAGTTKEDALLQGIYEIIERDAVAIWWYNRLPAKGVDLLSFNDKWLNHAPQYYQQYRRNIWLLDVSADMGVPVFVACSMRTDKPQADIIFGAGCHANPLIAAIRAVSECNQFLSMVRDVGITTDTYQLNDQMLLQWCQQANLENQPYFAPQTPYKLASDYHFIQHEFVNQDIEQLQKTIAKKGMELLAYNHTRPDIGAPVVRAIIPGMRHFRPRFAPGRLYDVPITTGQLAIPHLESELNPIPIII